MKELIVKTLNRNLLDKTLNSLGGVVSEVPESDGTWIVRSVQKEGVGFLKFVIIRQGYAEYVGERDIEG